MKSSLPTFQVGMMKISQIGMIIVELFNGTVKKTIKNV